MEHNKMKQGMVLLTYAAVLVLILIYCKDIIAGIGGIITLIKPFLIGIVIAFILSQPYSWLYRLYQEKCKIKEKSAHYLAIVSSYVLVIAVVATVFGVVIPQMIHSARMFASNLDYYVTNLQHRIDMFATYFDLEAIDLVSVAHMITQSIGNLNEIMGNIVTKIVSATGTMVSFFANMFIGIAFSVYLLAGQKKIRGQVGRLLRAYLKKDTYSYLRYMLDVITTSFKNYIIGQSTEAVILGSLCCLGMLILRLDYAGMVSMVVGLTAFIPFLGAYIGGAVAVILLFMVSPMKAVIFLIFFVILQQFENNVIYPRVVGGRIGLPGIWVLLAITVGGKLGGIVGMLFGVPLMTILYTLIKNSVRTRERRKEKLGCKK